MNLYSFIDLMFEHVLFEQLQELYAVKSTMEAVGRTPKMAAHTLLVL